MHRPSLAVALIALTTTVIASTAVVSGPANSATDPRLSIRVELDLPNAASAGPREFEVVGVTPGVGPELTTVDEVSNPSGWCGTISVDVDPSAKTVSVAPDSTSAEDPCDVETVKVTVSAPGFTDVRRTGGDLLLDASTANPVARTAAVSAGAMAMTWTTAPDEPLVLGGIEAFAYTTASTGTPTPTAPAPAAFVPKNKPFLKGRALVGRTLVVRNVSKTGFVPTASKISVKWYRSGKRIGGARGLAYTVKNADRGRKITARIVVSGAAPTKTIVLESTRVQPPRRR